MENIIKARIGYQGVPGSFSEQALKQFFDTDDNYTTKNFQYFEDVFQAVGKEIDFGVLPIENSSTGAISDVYDLLNTYNCYIVGETYVKVIHNLVGIKNASLDTIEEIYSHPQAFEQSKAYLSQYRHIKLIPYHNTALSAKMIKELNKQSVGAICSYNASKIYELEVLAPEINCNKENTTRFVIIGKQKVRNEKGKKISVIMSTEHKAGALYHVLRHFAENNINLLKLESRPIVNKPFEYNFYVDFEGNINNSILRNAIEKMEKDSSYFKYLGNY